MKSKLRIAVIAAVVALAAFPLAVRAAGRVSTPPLAASLSQALPSTPTSNGQAIVGFRSRSPNGVAPGTSLGGLPVLKTSKSGAFAVVAAPDLGQVRQSVRPPGHRIHRGRRPSSCARHPERQPVRRAVRAGPHGLSHGLGSGRVWLAFGEGRHHRLGCPPRPPGLPGVADPHRTRTMRTATTTRPTIAVTAPTPPGQSQRRPATASASPA